MIWQDMSDIEKNEIKDQYESIRKQIKSLNAIKANDEKKRKYSDQENEEYNDKILELQKQYDNIEVYYRCDYCNNKIKLSLDKIKTLVKDKAKPIFCNRKCSGIYYANKSHEGKTEQDKFECNMKISHTLRNRELYLSEEEKLIRSKKLNKFWNDLDKEQRSKRNKANMNKSYQTQLKNDTFGRSKDETLIYRYLQDKVEIKRCIYKGGCNFDFEIIYNNQITLIELNGIYWHHNKPFNNTEQEIEEYNNMINIKGHSSMIAKKWRYTDVEKLNYCKENNMNYICIYFNNQQLKRESEKVGKIILDNLNKGIVIILEDELSKLIAAIG